MYQGLAASTRRTYSSAQLKFINFCVMIGHVSSSGSPCPATEWTLCLFATFLANSLRHSSIKVYLSAVRSLHVDKGFPDPLENCLRLQRVVRGIKRSQGSLPANPRLPISSNILRIIHSALDLTSFDDHMFWAACLLAYFGFLRSAEFTVPSLSAFDPSRHLSVRDIAVDVPLNPSCLQICIKASKTDPFRKGCNILIGPGSPPLCAVQAVVSFLERRGNRPGPLFLFENGLPLSRSLLTDRLRAILLSAGLPGNFSSHSFRIGAATSAARAGIPDHLIQVLGRWESDAYKQYIRTPPDLITRAAKSMVD